MSVQKLVTHSTLNEGLKISAQLQIISWAFPTPSTVQTDTSARLRLPSVQHSVSGALCPATTHHLMGVSQSINSAKRHISNTACTARGTFNAGQKVTKLHQPTAGAQRRQAQLATHHSTCCTPPTLPWEPRTGDRHACQATPHGAVRKNAAGGL